MLNLSRNSNKPLSKTRVFSTKLTYGQKYASFAQLQSTHYQQLVKSLQILAPKNPIKRRFFGDFPAWFSAFLCQIELNFRLNFINFRVCFHKNPCYFLLNSVLLFIKFRVTFWKNVTRKLEKSNSNSDFSGLIIRFCRAQFQNPPNCVYFVIQPSVKFWIVFLTEKTGSQTFFEEKKVKSENCL